MTLLISHIPKTAGTSLAALVRRFNLDAEWVYENQLLLGSPNLDYLLNFQKTRPPSVVMGHFSFGAHRFLGLKPQYATVLRTPLDRVISFFRFQKSLNKSPFSRYFEKGISLEEFVTSGITETTNNHMCRMIAGIPPESGMVIGDQWLLDLAIHNLKTHYKFVGILENLNPFLNKLGEYLNWSNFKLPIENKTDGPIIRLDLSTIEVIHAMNSLDNRLYDYVKKNYSQP